MAGRSTSWLIRPLATLIAAACLGGACAGVVGVAAGSDPDVEAWVGQLGAKEFARREAAAQSLVDVGKAATGPLERAIRVQGNFNDYVPLIAVLLVVLELQSTHALVLHALGAALLVGRLLHAYGMSQTNENFRFRVSGMMLTFATLAVSAIGLIVMSVL